MSYGIVVCATCGREVHQDGPLQPDGRTGWTHCEGRTPICAGAKAVYPASTEVIQGKFCGRDG